MDDWGNISSWEVMSLKEGDEAGSVVDLTLNFGGKLKLIGSGMISLAENISKDFDPDTT